MVIPIILACLLGSPERTELASHPSGRARPCLARKVVLGLRPAAARRAELAEGMAELRGHLFRRGGAVRIDHIPQLGLVRVEIPEGEDLPSACGRLRELLDARYAEPDWIGEGGFIPNDTYYPEEWHLVRIQAPEAWEITRGSSAVTVAVLDTGIDPGHPEFAGRVLPGHDFVNDDDDPLADHPHGLYTAGILAANANNSFGVAGVDHRARILPVKVLDETNHGSQFDLVNGIRYAVDNGARVISMSLINYSESEALTDALRYAREKGVVLVACSGNGGTGDADISWPGASPLCITVGATTSGDRRASYSGSGLALDVVAPGSSIETVAPNPAIDGSTSFTGCSAATPVAAGIAAILLSVDEKLTPEEVQSLLEQGAEDLVGGADDPAGWDPSYGWGRVNALRSLRLLEKRFLRGDANADGFVDISDAIFILMRLYISSKPFPCSKAADSNDDGSTDISDAISTLTFLFNSGSMPAPHPECGIDLTPDTLDCAAGCQP